MLALLLSACEQTPSGPSSGSASLERAYFGSDDVRWFRHDSAGAWTMQPLLDSSRVYFERDLTFGPAPDYAVTSPSRMIALDRSNGSVIWSRPIVTGYNAAIAGSLVATVWGSLPSFDRSSGVPGPVFAYETSLTSNVASELPVVSVAIA